MASESKGSDGADRQIDENLYSRQIGAYGMEVMKKLVELRVLIVGLKGLGVEIAKNVVLAGPRAVTLYDPEVAVGRHQGSNFFVHDKDLGATLASASAAKLAELNHTVDVSVAAELTEALVASQSIVIFTEGNRETLLRWSDFCHNHTVTVADGQGGHKKNPAPIAFISTAVLGVSGYVFTDFGPKFTVRDATGETAITRAIESIEQQGETTVVRFVGKEEGGEETKLGDSEHESWLQFSDVRGMYATTDDVYKAHGLTINSSGPWRCKPIVRKYTDRNGKARESTEFFSVAIGDTRMFSPYLKGGVATQVKRPYDVSYRSLRQSLLQPTKSGELFSLVDGLKWGRSEQLHIAFQAVASFQQANGFLPRPNNAEDVAAVIAEATRINAAAAVLNKATDGSMLLTVDELDTAVVEKVARYASVQFQPVACFLGGVVAQEVIKLGGKFTPIDQWLYVDFFEVLPETLATDTTADVNERYYDLVTIFGRSLQQKVADSSTFLVGCGALGCELLKNFAMLGLGTGAGNITTTDNDVIEVSNLNRQFLFRSHNVGKLKSEASATAVLAMNPGLHITPRNLLVCEKTEDVFNGPFWSSLSFVTNALDNVHARRYVDGRCVLFERPLLESGTLGTMFNHAVIVPHLTQSYSDGPADAADEKQIPMCTLRNFPNLIDHCIEWARAKFTDWFVDPQQRAAKFVADPAKWLKGIQWQVKNADNKKAEVARVLPQMRDIQRLVNLTTDLTFERLVEYAADLFEDYFRNALLDLIAAFPRDAKDSEGRPFWSAGKRFPNPFELDLDNKLHLDFVIATANILAVSFGLARNPEEEPIAADHAWRKKETFAKLLRGRHTVHVPNADRGKASTAETAEADASETEQYKALLKDLAALNVERAKFVPADFEKDHDWNFHIDFITAATNLRAGNYDIAPATRHTCKTIAGKIIPAVATATASATGLVCIELMKVIQGKPLAAYRNSYNNLGVANFQFEEPTAPAKIGTVYDEGLMADLEAMPAGHTKWSKTLIEGNVTVSQFVQAFKTKTGANLYHLIHAVANREDAPYAGRALFPFESDEAKAEWADKPFKDYVESVYEGANLFHAGEQFLALEGRGSENDSQENPGKLYAVPRVVFKFA